MKLHREWMIDDLKRLQTARFAIKQQTAELETLELEFTAIKATNYNKLPSGSGDNTQRDKLELNIAKRQELTACKSATERHVADMERLLAQLSDEERDLLERTYIKHSRTVEQIAEEEGVTSRQIYNRQRDATNRLLELRFGQGYAP